MRHDRLGDMRLFVAAVELGSLSAAGRKLALSPAAASARLHKLEKAFETRLFERTTRHLRLTEEGQLYLEHCRIALQAVDDAELALASRRNAVRGRVRIAATSDFGRHLLLDWLDAFSAAYPDVAVSLTLSDAVTSFLHEDIDLAIRFGMPADGALNARRLAGNRRVLCAAPAYLERAGRPAQPAELAGHRFVLLHTRDGLQDGVTLRRLDAVVECRMASGQAWETNDGAVARAWLLAGRGIGFKSWWDVAADVGAGRLDVVLPDWETPAADVHALFHRRLLPLRVRLLLEFLAGRFAAHDQGQLPIT